MGTEVISNERTKGQTERERDQKYLFKKNPLTFLSNFFGTAAGLLRYNGLSTSIFLICVLRSQLSNNVEIADTIN